MRKSNSISAALAWHLVLQVIQALLQIGSRLEMRRTLARATPRRLPEFDSPIRLQTQREMSGHQSRFLPGPVGKITQQHLGDGAVNLLAFGAQQGVVGGVLDQRVAEAVGGVGRRTPPRHQARVNGAGEIMGHVPIQAAGHRADQNMGKCAADDGTDFYHLLDWA